MNSDKLKSYLISDRRWWTSWK